MNKGLKYIFGKLKKNMLSFFFLVRLGLRVSLRGPKEFLSPQLLVMVNGEVSMSTLI